MYRSVLEFWFDELTPAQWWKKDEALDQLITDRFGGLFEKARKSELFGWRRVADGRLAEIIMLDQFSRHIHRDTPDAFAQDDMALVLAQEAVSAAADIALTPKQRTFLVAQQ